MQENEGMREIVRRGREALERWENAPAKDTIAGYRADAQAAVDEITAIAAEGGLTYEELEELIKQERQAE